MKKIFPLWALTALMVATGVVQAQGEYHPVTDGCTWSVSNEKYMTAGDTVLDGKAYLKIYRHTAYQPFEFDMGNAVYFAAIRNDTAERKVYAYLPAGTLVHDNYSSILTDTAMEVLIYDFSLEIGDTVTFYILGDNVVKYAAVRTAAANIDVGWIGYSSVDHQYQESDSLVTLSDNSTRHQLFLRGLSHYSAKDNLWIEGVGSVRGFNEGPQVTVSDYGYRTLLCFTDGSGASFQTGFDYDNDPEDCFSNGFGGDVPERATDRVSVFPNPADNLLHIELSGAEIRSVVLYDLQGRSVETGRAPSLQGGTATLNLRNVPAGVYLLRVTDGEGKEYERKVVRN